MDALCTPATDAVPPSFTDGNADASDSVTGWYGIQRCCMDRHFGGVNVVFGDGSGRRVRIAELWTLDWSGAKSYSQTVPPTIEAALPAQYK